jgi:nicotinamide riboside transporter PnuC
MEWIVTVFSITGVVLNIYKIKWCFAIWAVTNFSWMVIDFYRGIYAQAFLFMVYFILAIYGLYRWSVESRSITA